MVASVITDIDGLRYGVIDHDCEGADEDVLMKVPQLDGSTADPIGHHGMVTFKPDRIAVLEQALSDAPNCRTPLQAR